MPEYDERQLIAITHEKVCDMHARLFGNGQPGEIPLIKRRISSLENWRWWLIGVTGGIGIVAGLIFS